MTNVFSKEVIEQANLLPIDVLKCAATSVFGSRANIRRLIETVGLIELEEISNRVIFVLEEQKLIEEDSKVIGAVEQLNSLSIQIPEELQLKFDEATKRANAIKREERKTNTEPTRARRSAPQFNFLFGDIAWKGATSGRIRGDIDAYLKGNNLERWMCIVEADHDAFLQFAADSVNLAKRLDEIKEYFKKDTSEQLAIDATFNPVKIPANTYGKHKAFDWDGKKDHEKAMNTLEGFAKQATISLEDVLEKYEITE